MTNDSPLRVVLVEQDAVLLRGLRTLLTEEGCEVVGSASSVGSARAVIATSDPDVVLIDSRVPGGPELANGIVDADSSTRVLVYADPADREQFVGSLDSGAHGFALRSAEPAELVRALETVARGTTYLDPRLKPMIPRRAPQRVRVLSERERTILGLLADGLTGEEIARELFLSPETIRTHIKNAMRKLGAHTRTHAIVVALREGEIEEERQPQRRR